jgi:anhydro-N-acetylmuramic acid kinase
MKQVKVIGIMSGSSLDGLDVDFSTFNETKTGWSYQNIASETFSFPDELQFKLKKADQISGRELSILDVELGNWIGEKLLQFCHKCREVPDLVSSHGHTVFHEPGNDFTLQIGNAEVIAQKVKLPVISDFRLKDILKGGQGAPLVVIGEKYLFPKYKSFLNLGGITNLTLFKEEEIKSFDIAPCNQVLNFFSDKLGFPYDDGGALAKKGKIDNNWLEYLKSLSFFQKSPPKSLSNQFTRQSVLKNFPSQAEDALNTYCHFLGYELEKWIRTLVPGCRKYQVLATGGGAKNTFLMDVINQSPYLDVIPADEHLIDYKEAMIFGFLGALRWFDQINILSPATGANSDSCSGSIYYP